MQESIQLVIDSAPFLLKGAVFTLTAQYRRDVLWPGAGLCAGLNAHVARLAGTLAGAFYISVFRGTPLIAQLFMIYYGLPQFGIELDPIPAAMIGLSLNTAAYTSETLRAAIPPLIKGSGKRRPVSV
jgi:cystine transport system permease protein